MPEAPRYLRNGRISLTRKLGEGGMAVVYEAYDHDLAVWRAVKFLKPDLAKRKSIRRRFIVEAQALAQLEHPNIVRVYDVGEEAGWPFLVMSLTRGGSLEAYLARNGPMDPYLAVRAMIEVCQGIQAAHDIGIIHRDLKPDNVLITSAGVCRVTDFGIAMLGDEQLRKTRTGSVMGTLGFMAPEQHKDAKHLSPAADIFSLGATLYALLSEEPPNDLSHAAHHPALLDHIPEVIRPVILGATAFVPNDRFSSAGAMADALQTTLTQVTASPEAETLAHIVTQPIEIPNRSVPSDMDSQPGRRTDGSVPAALPYVMPAPQMRGDEEPSYLDPEEEERARRKTEALARLKALQATSRASVATGDPESLPPQRMFTSDAPTTDGGTPTPVPRIRRRSTQPGAEDEVEANKHEIEADFAETASGAIKQLIEVLITFFVKPLKPMILPLIGLAILCLFLVGWGVYNVRTAAFKVYGERDELYTTIEQSQDELLDNMRNIAGEVDLHADRLKRMRAAEEPEKIELAFQYIDHISTDLQRRSVAPPPGTAHYIDRAHEHLNLLIQARRDYEREYDRWAETSSAGFGGLACTLRVTTCP